MTDLPRFLSRRPPPDLSIGRMPTYCAEWLRERITLAEERRLLMLARGGSDVCWADEDREPLVTIRIATLDRGELIVERAIRSALEQTYERIEILVVGDRCDDQTADAVTSVTDKRVRFINLGARGVYPSRPRDLWRVAGAHPMNVGTALAHGAWIAPCDDDDELTPDHVEVLLGAAMDRRLEMVYSKARMEVGSGEWREVGDEPLQHGRISHGSVMFSSGLRFMPLSMTSWKLWEPADWNLWKRMRRIGVRIGFESRITYRHYIEAHRRGVGEKA